MKQIKSPPGIVVYVMIVGCAALIMMVAVAEIVHWMLLR